NAHPGPRFEELLAQALTAPEQHQRSTALSLAPRIAAEISRAHQQAELRGVMAQIAPQLLDRPAIHGGAGAQDAEGVTHPRAPISLARGEQRTILRPLGDF